MTVDIITSPISFLRHRVSQKIGILRLVKHVFVDTSVFLRCYYAFVLPILEYCSPVWGLLLNFIFSFWTAGCIRWRGFSLITCRCVIDVMLVHCVCCTRLIRTRIIVCSVSFHLLLSEFDIPSCGCRSSIIVRFFFQNSNGVSCRPRLVYE